MGYSVAELMKYTPMGAAAAAAAAAADPTGQVAKYASKIPVWEAAAATAQAAMGDTSGLAKVAQHAIDEVSRDEEIARGKRFKDAEQCYLAFNWKDISRRSTNEWQRFVSMVGGTTNGSDNPLTGLMETVGLPLFNIRAIHLAALVPTVKLWFLGHSGERRIYFPDHQPEINDIFKDGPSRGAGVGLKSVTFEQSMKHSQEEGTKNILTRIVIYFRDANTFAQPQGTGSTAFSWYDLLLVNPKQTAEDEDLGTARITADEWSLRMEVGWADPGRVLLDNYNKDISNSIQKVRQTLLLAKYKHAFKFNQDGSLELTLDLIGKFEDVAGDRHGANVFAYDREFAATLKSAQAGRASSRMSDPTEFDEFSKKYRLGAHAVEKDSAEYAYTSAKLPSVMRKQAAREDPEGYARYEAQEAYESDLSTKSGQIADAKAQIPTNLLMEGHLKFVDVPVEEMTIFTADGINTVGGTLQEIISRAMLAPEGQLNPNDAQFLEDFGDDTHSSQDRSTPGSDTGTTHWSAGNGVDAYDEAYSEVMTQVAAAKADGNQEKVDELLKNWKEKGSHNTIDIAPASEHPNHHRIYYFYLGSLIDIALKNFIDNKQEKAKFGEIFHSTHVFGEMPILDLKALADALSQNKGTAGRSRMQGTVSNIPIANLAIGWKAYSIWYLNEIIRKEIVQMSVTDFIDSVVQQFVPSICEECFGSMSTAAAQPKVNQLSLSVPAKTTKPHPSPGKGLIVGDDTHIKSSGTVTITPSFKIPSHSVSINKPTENYIFIFGTDHSEKSLTGDPNIDLGNGIYHFRVGADAGILKSVEFVEQPDKRAETAAVDGASEYHTRRYNVNLRLVGNVLLKPADKIYIAPFVHGTFRQGVGVGFPNEQAFMDASGLGGYHIVKKIAHTIKAGVYDTEVEAWSQTMKHNLDIDPEASAEAYEKAHREQMDKGGGQTSAENLPPPNGDRGPATTGEDYSQETYAVDETKQQYSDDANSFKWSDFGWSTWGSY